MYLFTDRCMQSRNISFFFVLIGYSLWGGKTSGSGRVRALNLTVSLGSGRVGSDDLGYGPGSGFSLKPVQTSTLYEFLCYHTSNNCNITRVLFLCRIAQLQM